ncbi:MAG: TetR/AcrR family transcriptional regulator [Myxococcota bacterium]
MSEPNLVPDSAPDSHKRPRVRAKTRSALPRGPGRPRNAERHAAILNAARELIMEVGYGGLTLDAIAKRAGASRTTLYQWWGGRAPLVEEAIFSDYGEWPVPNTGTFVGDLNELVEEIVNEMSRPHVARAFPALSAEFQADKSLKAGLRARYGDAMIERWREVFKRAVARKELPQDANAEAALQLTIGSVLMLTQSKIMPRKKLKPYLHSVLSQGLTS